jgi:DNA polymerase-1
MSLLESALHYAEHGIPVFPVHGIDDSGNCTCRNPSCSHPGKHPMVKGGFKAATTDGQQIIICWKQQPQANIGVPTGKVSGWYVVDIDKKNQGIEHYNRFVETLADQVPSPTLIAHTGGGGYHLFYGQPANGQAVGCGTNIGRLEGVDFRGDGGYIVVTPSMHYSQQPYRWSKEHAFKGREAMALESLPIAIAELLKLSATAINQEFITPGGRNDALFRRACQLRRDGIPDDALYTLLLNMNESKCRPPLDKGEVAMIAGSALNRDIMPKVPSKETYQAKPGEEVMPKLKKKKADEDFERLMDLAKAHEFWVDDAKKAYVTFPVMGKPSTGEAGQDTETLPDSHFENWPIISPIYRQHLSNECRKLHKSAPAGKVLESVLDTLAGDALFNDNIYKTYIRIARFEDRLFVDLTNDEWTVAEISTTEWSLHHAKPPVKFLRGSHTKPMHIPDPTGSFDNLREAFRLKNEDDYILLAAWMMFSFVEGGPYPILTLEGTAGSAKSTMTKHIKQILDPRKPDIQIMPRKIDDLFVQALHTHLLAFDNASGIKQEMSDTLCTIATGSGSIKRQLYTDADLFLFEACRPILINSINPVVEFSDLSDRCIRLILPPITNQNGDGRLSAEEVDNRFQRLAPKILGALFDALQKALGHYRRIKSLPAEIRMADFAAWSIAAGEALAPGNCSFLRAMMANRRFNAIPFLEENVLNSAVMKFVQTHPEWSGTPTALYNALRRLVNPDELLDKSFPKQPNQLTRELNKSITTLKQFGIHYTPPEGSNHKNRTITIRYMPDSQGLEDAGTNSDFAVTWHDRLEALPISDLTDQSEPIIDDYRTDAKPVLAADPFQHGNRLINTVEEAVIALNALVATNRQVGLDIETTGLNPHQDKVCLIQLFDGRQTLILDIRRIGDWTALKPALEKIQSVAHNAVFDMSFLQAQGITLEMDCTLLAHHVLTGERKSLKDLAQQYLNITLDKAEQTSDWNGELTANQLSYAAQDAQTVLALFTVLQDKLLERQVELAYQRVRDAQPFVVAMQLNGIAIDQISYQVMLDELKIQHEELVQRWQARLPEINFNSPQQLSAWIAGELIEPDENWPKTEANHYSTKADDLILYKASLSESAADTVDNILLPLKRISKEISAFGDKFLSHIDADTGRIHASFNLAGTVTGRMSCSNPNLQQIPRQSHYRQMFKAADGYKLVIADYSQMELRIAAMLADEQTLLGAYVQGQDTHRLTAALILGKEPEEISAEERQLAKAVNFGLLYGQGARGLQAYAASSYGINIDIGEAMAYREAWFESYPAFARWHNATYRLARNEMMVSTPSGRKRYFTSTEYSHPQGLKRAVVFNTPVQGGGAEVLLVAMDKLSEAIRIQGHIDTIKPIAVIHDEIILEARNDCAKQAKQLLEAAMVDGMLTIFPKASTQDLVEAHIGNSWADK